MASPPKICKRLYFMKWVPSGAFCTLLPHMWRLSDYKMPQKVAQNDRLALLLKMVCRTHFPQKFLSLRKNPIHAQKNRVLALSGYGCLVYGYAVAHPTHHIHRPATNRKTTDNGAPGPPTLSLIPLRQKPLRHFRPPSLRQNPQSEPPTC